MIGHVKIFAKITDLVKLQIVKSQIDRNGTKLERMRIETAQPLQSLEQCKTVLAAGDADGDLIAGLYHMIIINSLACKAVYLL